MEDLKYSDFANLVSTKFRMHLDPSNILDLELIEAKDLSGPGQQQFSLIFQGPVNCPLTQRMFSIEHEDLGQLDLFLVPIARDKDAVRYQAIFNRLI